LIVGCSFKQILSPNIKDKRLVEKRTLFTYYHKLKTKPLGKFKNLLQRENQFLKIIDKILASNFGLVLVIK